MHWRKVKVLGSGSYGTVSLARPMNVRSSSMIYAAVKSAEFNRSSSLREEGRILHALRGSEYVVECFGEDVSVENGNNTYNLMLEYAARGTLDDLIHKSKIMLGESEAAYYAFQILKGISHVHNKGIKLADFGLSLISDDSWKKHHHFRGTLVYASPESVTSGVYGKQVDIWALGCIVVEMITGKRIWSRCKSKKELAWKIARLEPALPYNISNDGKDFLKKCLERDNNQRWTAEMLLDHPFMKNINAKNMNCGLIHKCNWISTQHLFSTISPYYPNQYSSCCSRGTSSNSISSLETNNYK
uniref:Protein kinase domain-containing protein n=1 Tax=Solanum lycopersicum TaxID=4081 RepID=A0A3Q7HPV4_SOLLC